jgi:hypothetical protein
MQSLEGRVSQRLRKSKNGARMSTALVKSLNSLFKSAIKYGQCYIPLVNLVARTLAGLKLTFFDAEVSKH